MIRFITKNEKCKFGKLSFQNRFFLESDIYTAKHVNIHTCIKLEMIRLWVRLGKPDVKIDFKSTRPHLSLTRPLKSRFKHTGKNQNSSDSNFGCPGRGFYSKPEISQFTQIGPFNCISPYSFSSFFTMGSVVSFIRDFFWFGFPYKSRCLSQNFI